MIIITKNNVYKWQPKVLLKNITITIVVMLLYTLFLYYIHHILLLLLA